MVVSSSTLLPLLASVLVHGGLTRKWGCEPLFWHAHRKYIITYMVKVPRPSLVLRPRSYFARRLRSKLNLGGWCCWSSSAHREQAGLTLKTRREGAGGLRVFIIYRVKIVGSPNCVSRHAAFEYDIVSSECKFHEIALPFWPQPTAIGAAVFTRPRSYTPSGSDSAC